MIGATKIGEMYRTIDLMQEHIAQYTPQEAVMYILYTLHGTSRCSDAEVLELAELARKDMERRKNPIDDHVNPHKG